MKRTLEQIENDGFQDRTILGKLYEVDEEHAAEQLPYLVSQMTFLEFNPERPIFMLIRSRFFPVRRRDDNYYYFDEGGRPTHYAVHFTLDNLIALMKVVEHPFDTFNYVTKELRYSGDVLYIFDHRKSMEFNDDVHGRDQVRQGVRKITHIGFFSTPQERTQMLFTPSDEDDQINAPRPLNTDAVYGQAIYKAYENVERFTPNVGYKSERKGLFFAFKLDKEKLKQKNQITEKWNLYLRYPEQYLEEYQIPFGREEQLSEEKGSIDSLYDYSLPCLLKAVKPFLSVDDFKVLQDQKIIYGIGAKTRDFKKFIIDRGYGLRIYRIQPVGDKFKVNSDFYPKRIPESSFPHEKIVRIMFWEGHWMKGDVDMLRFLEISKREGYLIRLNAYEYAQHYANFSYDKMLKFNEDLFFEEHESGYKFTEEIDYEVPEYKESKIPNFVVFADFESSVDEEFHKPYLISFEGVQIDFEHDSYEEWFPMQSLWKSPRSEEVAFLFLQKMVKFAKHIDSSEVIRIYFYNLHYDFTFILPYVTNVERLEKDNTLYSVVAKFWGVKFEFWDAFPIFRTSLKEAAFNYLTPQQKQRIRKEVYPYKLYTFKFFEENPDGLCDLDLFMSYLTPKQREELDPEVIKAASFESYNNSDFQTVDEELLECGYVNEMVYSDAKLEKTKFNYVGYARFYCSQDVRCLRQIMLNFANLLHGANVEGINGVLPFKLCLWQYRTASAIGYDYFKRTTLFTKHYNAYFPLYKWCFPKGVLRTIIQRTIRGGRVMTRDNQKWHYFAESPDSFLQDYDGVALYPSAMSLLWVTEGAPELIKGDYNEKDIEELFYPPDLEYKKEENYEFTDGCIHVTYINTRKDRHFPLLCVKDDKTKLNNYKNFHNENVSIWVNVIDLFNLIEFQDAEIRWDGAVVWRGPRRYELRESIQKLFDFRKRNKKHPIQLVVKLILNSIYGKSILKPVDREKIYVEKIKYRKKTFYHIDEQFLENHPYKKYVGVDNWQEFFNANAYRIHRFEDVSENLMDVELYKRDMSSSFNIFGSDVLAMARRIIGRVMALAEDIEEAHPELSPGLFYTDTDSMHIRGDLLKLLEIEFKKKYKNEIKGSEMTQFHIDFDTPENFAKGEEIMGAQESYFLMKKAYCDKLIGNKGNVGYHMRLKGVPTDVVNHEDYKKIYDGESITYDLLDGHVRFFYKNGKVGSRLKMTREIMTRETREKRKKQ